MNVVIEKIPLRNANGVLLALTLKTKSRQYHFPTRNAALVANRTFQKLQTFDKGLIEGIRYEESER